MRTQRNGTQRRGVRGQHRLLGARFGFWIERRKTSGVWRAFVDGLERCAGVHNTPRTGVDQLSYTVRAHRIEYILRAENIRAFVVRSWAPHSCLCCDMKYSINVRTRRANRRGIAEVCLVNLKRWKAVPTVAARVAREKRPHPMRRFRMIFTRSTVSVFAMNYGTIIVARALCIAWTAISIMACGSSSVAGDAQIATDSWPTDDRVQSDATTAPADCALSCTGNVDLCATTARSCSANSVCVADRTASTSYCTERCEVRECISGFRCEAASGFGELPQTVAVCRRVAPAVVESLEMHLSFRFAPAARLPDLERVDGMLELTGANSILRCADGTGLSALIWTHDSFSSTSKVEELRWPMCQGGAIGFVGLTLVYDVGRYSRESSRVEYRVGFQAIAGDGTRCGLVFHNAQR